MTKCPYLDRCPYLKDKLASGTPDAKAMMNRYCLSDPVKCSIYMARNQIHNPVKQIDDSESTV